MIKVIPTAYKGVTYRSRTEARWAVFFEAMGWPFTYEAEGANLDGEWYLPDFWLPAFQTFVEIKGADPTDDERRLAAKLHDAPGKRVLLIAGAPGRDTHKVWDWRDGKQQNIDDEYGPFVGSLRSCRRCDRTVVHLYVVNERWETEKWKELTAPSEPCRQRDCGDRYPVYQDDIRRAFAAASNERFGVHE